MFGFSWAEILLTSAIALVVIGPKDIPKVMFQIGRLARRANYLKFAMSRQFEEFLKEHDLDLNDPKHTNFEAKPTDELMADQEYMTALPFSPLRGEGRVGGSLRDTRTLPDAALPPHPTLPPQGGRLEDRDGDGI